MGNVPYYLSMPHIHTWYVYQRDEHHQYEEAPVDIWNNISQQEAIRNFLNLLQEFRKSSARVIYLYKGVQRKIRVSKNMDKLVIESKLLENIITHFDTYERVDVHIITCTL